MTKLKKVVINTVFGGFGLSTEGLARYNAIKGTTLDYADNIDREDPALIKTIEEMGEKAYEGVAVLKIVGIPANVKYSLDDYDGIESIHEEHRSWS